MANKATKKTITQQQAEQVAVEVAKKNNPYRDEKGVRIQTYRRFKEGIDYESVEPDEMVALTQNILDNLDAFDEAERTGRPRKYETVGEFKAVVKGYIDYIRDANIDGVKLIPDIEGLCAYMGICRETLLEWERSRDPVYSDTIKMVKNQIAYFKKQLALKGKIPPVTFATDFNNNHGYTQKQEVQLSANNPLGSDSDPATMAQKYQNALPETTIETE
jgi:hypothetical protein